MKSFYKHILLIIASWLALHLITLGFVSYYHPYQKNINTRYAFMSPERNEAVSIQVLLPQLDENKKHLFILGSSTALNTLLPEVIQKHHTDIAVHNISINGSDSNELKKLIELTRFIPKQNRRYILALDPFSLILKYNEESSLEKALEHMKIFNKHRDVYHSNLWIYKYLKRPYAFLSWAFGSLQDNTKIKPDINNMLRTEKSLQNELSNLAKLKTYLSEENACLVELPVSKQIQKTYTKKLNKAKTVLKQPVQNLQHIDLSFSDNNQNFCDGVSHPTDFASMELSKITAKLYDYK
jgi:predicted nucleotidyltransferase